MARKLTYEELEQRVRELEKQAVERKQVEKVAREATTLLEKTFSSLKEVVFLVDPVTRTIMKCNPAIRSVFGYEVEEVVGRNAKFLHVNQEMYEEFGKKLFTDLDRKGVFRTEYQVRRRDGSTFFTDHTVTEILDDSGRRMGLVSVIDDIDKRKRAERALRQSERHYRKLLDFVPYPLVVFTLDGKVSYLNTAFTSTFGWTLAELKGKKIPYVPPGFQQETSHKISELFEQKMIKRYETRRLTRNGKILDVVITAAFLGGKEDTEPEQLVIFRDITQEKRIARNNEAMLRVSTSLPEYPDLEELLDYISGEIKGLLDVEGAVVVLFDEEREEFFFYGAAHEDPSTQQRIKKIRFKVDQIAAGEVIRTGQPNIVHDAFKERNLYPERNKRLGFQVKNFLQVPLRNKDRIIGVLSAFNKKDEIFTEKDVELLDMIGATVALFIENARVSEEIKKAYREVDSLNRAKDKVFHHLSHELKTPMSVVSSALTSLVKRLEKLPEETWKPTMERAKRNINRLLQIQLEVDDIIQERHYKTYHFISHLLDACADELEALFVEEVGEHSVIERVRERVDELFGGGNGPQSEKIVLSEYINEIIRPLKPLYSHREIRLITHFENSPPLFISRDVLHKVVEGLVRNAIENTPDEGKIEISVAGKEEGTQLVVRDFGVGITDDQGRRIFEGFYTTQEIMDYSTKKPFDFDAGGKGMDLLRMKIFSERYNFQIDMTSSRCRFIPKERDICPGKISECGFCKDRDNCHSSGGSTFSIFFPKATE